jgi:hypothetical protein
METPKEVIMPVETANKVLAFLATKPYNEVAQLINEVQQSARPYVAPTEPTIAETPITKP